MKPFFVIFITLFVFGCNESKRQVLKTNYAVEYLIFEVNPEKVNEFVALEHEIWSAGLSTHPGLVSKEIWINENKPSEVTVIIYWESMEAWKSVPRKTIDELTKKFDAAFGAENYKMVDEKHIGNRWIKVSEYY